MKLFLKNKKYAFMIIFFMLLFFIFDNCYALVYKGKDYNNSFVQREKAGTLNQSNRINVIRFEWSTPIDKDQYNGIDLFAVKFDRINFSSNSTITNNNSSFTFSCSQYTQATNNDYECLRGGISPNANNTTSTFKDGEITIVGYVLQDGGSYNPCWFSNEVENSLICPFVEDNIKYLDVEISYTGYDTIYYDLFVGNMKVLYNYDSTEIVNALSQVQQQQVNTVTTIENFNNYVSNNNTSQSQTQSTTALSGLTTNFNSHLNQMNELTRLAFMPVNFILDIADSTCQPLVWEIPFVNSRVIVSCMSTIYNGYFSVVVGVISTVMTSLITYRCCLKLFNTIKGVLDAEDDKIEVVDL